MKESDKTEINIIVSKSEENTDNKIQINPKLSPDLNNGMYPRKYYSKMH